MRDSVTGGPRMPLRTDDHQALDPGAVLVVLARAPARRPAGCASSLPRSTSTSLGSRPCWIDAGDDVALLAGELAELDVVLGVAQPLQDDLLGGRRGDPAEAGRGVVELARPRCPPRRSPPPSTVTWPVLRSSSHARAAAGRPASCGTAMRRACSIASTSRSKEISFSRSSTRRMLMSMSIDVSCRLASG